jgi:hypothetical protein
MSPCFKFQLPQGGLLPGDSDFRCPHQYLLRMRGVRRIRVGVSVFFSMIVGIL